jgi:SAM-dependent methyltransferase
VETELELRTLAAEDAHWWYRGRRTVVMDAVRRSVRPTGRPRILDAGCGGGATLAEVARIGDATGVEPSAPSRRRAAARGVAPVLDAHVEALPVEDGRYDLVLLLDVLEHVDDESAALREIHRVVAPGGALILTVPAHPRLWSRHDELNRHRCRYTRRSLVAAARASGWYPARVTHFMSLLLPAAVLARRVGRGDGLDIPPGPVNRLLCATIEAEGALIRAGASLPFGLSLLAELRRV